jgi:predicted GNAT family acetyltransferase
VSSGVRASPLDSHAAGAVVELTDADLPVLDEFVDRDPYVNVVLRQRLDDLRTLEPAALGGTTYGVVEDAGNSSRLAAAAFLGGNLLPLGGDAAGYRALGRHLAGRRRTCSSIVGRADAVGLLWAELADAWGPARLVRDRQPLLVADAVTDDDRGVRHVDVRPATPADLDAYFPAAVAMFREELDLPPLGTAALSEYRRRVQALLRAGRGFVALDRHGAVTFKADVGAVSAATCQVQGVWTRPDLRRQGLATAAMAEVLRRGLELAPTVSLYVNDFNEPARRLYARLGMRQHAVVSTILF